MFEPLRKAVSDLTLYSDVFDDAIGQTFKRLISSEGDELRQAYRDFFALLVEEGEFYSGTMIGDVWQNHILDRILADENVFSRKAEIDPAAVGESVLTAVGRDLALLQRIFTFDHSVVAERTLDWSSVSQKGAAKGYVPDGSSAAEIKRKLAGSRDWSVFAGELASYYHKYGVGLFARSWAFRWSATDCALEEIRQPDPITFNDLIGYENERLEVTRNTERFLAGFPANNMLLYGERGTGKSSTVKALVHAYGPSGLRLVEVAKKDLRGLPGLLKLLRNRPQKFILFIDDLSFDEHETEYKDLKAILEGSLESKPDNVLLYATSNRRHLVKEQFGDRDGLDNWTPRPGEELRRADTIQEKLSLADRFGITVIFPSPDQEKYLSIVAGLAKQRKLPIEKEELRRRALQWEVWQNGRSGRTARQFIDYLTAELLGESEAKLRLTGNN